MNASRFLALIIGLSGPCITGCSRAVDTSTESGYIAPPSASRIAPASAESRARVEEFWSVYQTATREKQMGRWESAARHYRRSSKLDPDHWDSLYYLGNCLVELGRFEEARQSYSRLADSDPQAARAYSALGYLHSNPRAGSLFDLAEAERMYHQAQHSNGDESGSVLRLGEVCLAAGKVEKSREYLSAAAATNPKSVSARLLLAYIHRQSGDPDGGGAYFRQAVSLASKQKPVEIGLGEGDTKLPGARAMVRTTIRGLFDDLTDSLVRDSAAGSPSPEQYERMIESRIRELRAR